MGTNSKRGPGSTQAVKRSLRKLISRTAVVGELLGHLWEQKLWWMVPMVVVLVLVGVLLVFAQGSALAPFVYTLF